MKCYECKHRRDAVGSAHSSCNVISSACTDEENPGMIEIMLSSGKYLLTDQNNEPLVKLDPHGVKNGWAMWPMNFDPVWVEGCLFFKEKENETLQIL